MTVAWMDRFGKPDSVVLKQVTAIRTMIRITNITLRFLKGIRLNMSCGGPGLWSGADPIVTFPSRATSSEDTMAEMVMHASTV